MLRVLFTMTAQTMKMAGRWARKQLVMISVYHRQFLTDDVMLSNYPSCPRIFPVQRKCMRSEH